MSKPNSSWSELHSVLYYRMYIIVSQKIDTGARGAVRWNMERCCRSGLRGNVAATLIAPLKRACADAR